MPDAKVLPVALSGADREQLLRVVSAGSHPARMIMRARVLLALDEEDSGSAAHRAAVSPTGRGHRDDRAFDREAVRRDRW